MSSLSSFLDMGGYGAFVWPSFGLSAVLLIGILVVSIWSLKANRTALDALSTETSSKGSSHGETQA